MTKHDLANEMAQDAALWQAWSESGVGEDTVLTVDFTFYASKENRARALAAELERAGYRVETRAERTLFVFKGWLVEAHLTGTWSLTRLQDRTRDLCSVAERYGVLYDGAGAEMP